MNKLKALRLFRLFSLIGCRGVCYAPGAAHSNLSDYAMFQILSIFSSSFADSAFVIVLLKICLAVSVETKLCL